MQFIWIGMIGTLSTILYMFYFASKKTGIQLAIFTVFETLSLCAISVLYGYDITLISMLVTIGLTAGLGVYALTTKINYNKWFGLFSSGLTCVLMIGLINMFIGSPMLYAAKLYLGTVVFLGYIVLDIQYFLNSDANSYIMNHIGKYGVKDLHIIAALNIYLDVINLFIRLLEITKNMKGSNTRNRNRSL
jgi:FtsH-binding integral membrane protein